jgi:uncharacterized protein YecE (DUF72 family)
MVGCSGWSYPHWRGRVYPRDAPATRWLQLYSQRFDVVEVNATFYRLPTRRAVERWVRETPDDFVFTVKASRYLTHVKRLRGLRPGLRRLRERIAPLEAAGKLGPLLWQLPPNFARDDARLAAALDELGRGRHAFEFWHPSWFTEEVEAPTSASMTAEAAKETTPSDSLQSGRSDFAAGAVAATCSSTTTGRALRSQTRCGSATFSRPAAAHRDLDGVDRLRR